MTACLRAPLNINTTLESDTGDVGYPAAMAMTAMFINKNRFANLKMCYLVEVSLHLVQTKLPCHVSHYARTQV